MRYQRCFGVLTGLSLLSLSLLLPTSARSGEGEDLYLKHCKRCHAKDGTAAGKEKMLKVLKLQDKGLEALSVVQKSTRDMSDGDMKTLILEGKKDTKMKGFKKKLQPDADKNADAIVKFVRELQAKAK